MATKKKTKDTLKKMYGDKIEKAELFLEYKKNPVKWAEECVYLPTAGGDKLMTLHKPQKRIMKSFYQDHYLILLKSRQTGFSTICQVMTAHIATFYDNCVMGIVSRDGAEASDFNRKVLDILEKQPKWLIPKFHHKSQQSFITDTGNQLWSSPVSPTNPQKTLRGKSIVLLIIDEAAFIRNIDVAWTGIAPALSKAQMDAEKNNIPFGTVILSTPNRTVGTGQWYFQRWESANANPQGLWKAHKVHWKEIDQFKNDPKWYKTQCEVLENNSKKIAQELELQFVASDDAIWDDAVQSRLQEPKPDPVKEIKISSTEKLWYFKDLETDYFPRERFVLFGVDTASDFGQDYSTIEVIDFETFEQIAEYKGKCTVKKFVKTIKFLTEMFPKNILLVENSGLGNQTCEELYVDANKEYNIYGSWKDTKVNGIPKKVFKPGIDNTAKTRPLIMDALMVYVNQYTDLIVSERLALELIGLVDKGSKIQADVGAHDDLVMAYAFCAYARHYLTKDLNMLESNFSSDVDNSSIGNSKYHNPIHDLIADGNETSLGLATTTNSRANLNKKVFNYYKDNSHNSEAMKKDLLEILYGEGSELSKLPFGEEDAFDFYS